MPGALGVQPSPENQDKSEHVECFVDRERAIGRTPGDTSHCTPLDSHLGDRVRSGTD